ncbi:MAG TPA: glycosyltransferase [Actinoplanes sp.]|nr:glycosyltransferase [Actinoplanes sp.]
MKVAHVNVGGGAEVDGIVTSVTLLADAQRASGLAEVRVVDRAEELPQLLNWRPDVVHLHSAFRPRHVQLARALRRRGIPYVVSPHSALSAGSLSRQSIRKKLWIALFDRHLFAGAAAVCCLSPVEESDVRASVPRATTRLLPNIAVPPPAGAGRVAAAPGRPQVITLSRYDVYQKGLDRIVAVAALLPEVDFTVYGSLDQNDPAAAQTLIDRRPANVTFAAPVRDRAKEQAFGSATLYFQPSRWEGMSMSVIEAMARGLPCVVSQYVADTFGPVAGDICFAVPDEAAAAAQQITTLLAAPQALAATAARAQDWVQAELTPQAIAQRSLDLYRRAVGELPDRSRTTADG